MLKAVWAARAGLFERKTQSIGGAKAGILEEKSSVEDSRECVSPCVLILLPCRKHEYVRHPAFERLCNLVCALQAGSCSAERDHRIVGLKHEIHAMHEVLGFRGNGDQAASFMEFGGTVLGRAEIGACSQNDQLAARFITRGDRCRGLLG
jgi:hypothetical protein